MALDSLPDELIALICGFCKVPEIKNLRLTCRTLQKVANEYLLCGEIVLFMNRESLEACKGIAAHPVLSKTAKSLWIQADQPKKTTFEKWNEDRKRFDAKSYWRNAGARDVVYGANSVAGLSNSEIKALGLAFTGRVDTSAEQFNTNDGTPGLSDEQLAHHYAHATRMATEAQEMLWDGSLLKSLRSVLAQCTKLEAVDLTLGHAVRICTAQYNKAFARGLLYPYGDCNEYSSGVGALTPLVVAASGVGFKPKMLRLGCFSHYIFMNEIIVKQLQDFFRGLEELEWLFPIPYLDKDLTPDSAELASIVNDFNTTNKFHALIEHAVRLRRLHLELPGDDEISSFVPLRSVVGNVTWSQLTRIHITGFEATLDDLSNFLLRHDTLATVLLGDVCLQRAEWPQCFAAFAGRLPSIKEFELRGYFEFDLSGSLDWDTFYWFGHLDSTGGNRYGRQVSNYLLSGGKECPPKPDDEESTDEERSDEEEDTDEESSDEERSDEEEDTNESEEDLVPHTEQYPLDSEDDSDTEEEPQS